MVISFVYFNVLIKCNLSKFIQVVLINFIYLVVVFSNDYSLNKALDHFCFINKFLEPLKKINHPILDSFITLFLIISE